MLQWRWVIGCLLTVVLLAVWLVSKGTEAGGIRWSIALFLPFLISGYGLKKQSLESTGAASAVVVGFLLTAASACFSVSLIVFFVTSSRLTKWKAAEKRRLEDGYKEGGQRNWVQVVCNGGVASLCALIYLVVVGMRESPLGVPPDMPSLLSLAVLAALSCSCGDTWASEIGSVIGGKPRLITSWSLVPTGTNGGVTAVGVACSITGGTVIGLSHFLTLLVFSSRQDVSWLSQVPLVWAGAISGLIGSLIDSVLGATLQFSGFSEKLGRVVNAPGPGVTHISGWNILSNHTVNLVSSLITAIVIPVSIWTVMTLS